MSGGHTKPKCPNGLPVDLFGPAPGYWTELVITHDWPPGWEPSEWGTQHAALSAIAAEARAARVEQGHSGTIVGLSKHADARLAGFGG